MKHPQIAVFAIVAFVFLAATASAQSVTPADLKPLEGGEWVGELTYLDYSSNEKTTIKSNLKVAASSDARTWQFDYIYPKEPKANGKSEVKLSADGRIFNEQKVIEKSKLADGTLKIVTTKEGTDNDKKSLFRFTYLLTAAKFSIRKEVRTEGTETYFERNTYSWTR